MNNPHFQDLGSAIDDVRFADVDMALRRGRHIDREDVDWYAYLLDAQGMLEEFYRRFACELQHRSDGYFFLLPTGEKLSRRQLSVPEMLVGQGVALLYLDPRTIESGGVVTRDTVLSHLATVMGTDALMQAFNGPKRRRLDERVAQEGVRARVAEALRKLAGLGFVELLDADKLRLRASLMRFAEPVRGSDSPAAALEKLVARGEVALASGTERDEGDEPAREGDDDFDADPDEDVADEAAEPLTSDAPEATETEDAEPEDAEPEFDAWGLDDDFPSSGSDEERPG